MDVEITKMDGTSIKLSDIGVEARDFIVGSIEINPHYSAIDGRSGHVDMGADYGGRTIVVPFLYKAHDLHGVALKRDELYGLISDTEPFYVREMRRIKEHPGFICDDKSDIRKYKVHDYDNYFVGGKRYKVRSVGGITVDQTGRYGFGEITLETTDLPFAESIGTSSDIDRDGINAVSAQWGYGMGLITVDSSLKYTHDTRTFRIYNAGNVGVHPFEQYLRVGVEGVAKGYRLENSTTGDVFEVTGDISGGLVIEGATVTNNGLQAFRDTNRRFITLAPGWNEFTQNMAKKVAFDFRFYYR